MKANTGLKVCQDCGNFTSKRQTALQGILKAGDGICLSGNPEVKKLENGVRHYVIRIVNTQHTCDTGGYITPEKKREEEIREMTLRVGDTNFMSIFHIGSPLTEIAKHFGFQSGGSGFLFMGKNHQIRTIGDFLRFTKREPLWKEVIERAISSHFYPERLLKENPRWEFITTVFDKILKDFS